MNVANMKITAFTIAAIYGTIGGAMYAHFMGYINPSSFNIDLSTNYVIMLMVGGLESVVGCLVGAAVVTLGAIFFPNGWLNLAVTGIKKVLYRIGIRPAESGGGK